jgi:nitrite reductase/ring-hydroxylating ferredoxin subunit
MTFGTLAAQILSDACLGVTNRFAELYSVRRLKPLASLRSLLGENIDFPLHLLSDRVRPPDVRDVSEIAPGDGKIVRVHGQRLAVYRDEAGALHALSPICTHMGCHVAFNPAEKTWDCPCHGSRFDVRGAVLDGPATHPLTRKDSEISA